MNHEIQLNSELMGRIRTVGRIRMIIHSPFTNVLIAGALVFISSIVVSIKDVFSNTMDHIYWGERFSYVYSSFLQSGAFVQTLAFFVICSCVLAIVSSIIRFKDAII